MKAISKDFFKINGVSSRSIEDIFVNTPEFPPFPEMRVSDYDVGDDSNLYVNDDSFEFLRYSLVFFVFDRNTYDNSDINGFLANPKTLEISRLDGYYFKVVKLSADVQQEKDGRRIKYTLNFTLQPFKYATENEWIQVQSGDEIYNRGTRYSKPTIELTGAGRIDINCNGDVFSVVLDDGGQDIIIDSDGRMVYDNATRTFLYNRSSGLYPLLNTGRNVIQFNGNVGTLRIRKNERFY